jgi:hypothetical protein
MVVNCEQVWREVSNYLDGGVDPNLRAAIEDHVRGCRRCAAVVDGTRNIIQLYGDERMIEVPLGFSYRLHQKLDASIVGPRRTFLGWMVAAAAAVLMAGGIELARLSERNIERRAPMAETGHGVPPDLRVVVAPDGKLFHLAGCEYIHGKDNLRTLTAAQAAKEGYTPCPRCLKKYLT